MSNATSKEEHFLNRLTADAILVDAYELRADRDFKFGPGDRNFMLRNIYLDCDQLYLPKGTIFYITFYAEPNSHCIVNIVEHPRGR